MTHSSTPSIHLISQGSFFQYRWFASPSSNSIDFTRDVGKRGFEDLKTLVHRAYSRSPLHEDESLEEIGRVLFHYLIPEGLQTLIRQHRGQALTIHGGSNLVPWELLHDGEDFLGMRLALGRRPSWVDPDSIPPFSVPVSSFQQLRVVMCADPQMDLPEAQQEQEFLVDGLPLHQPRQILQGSEIGVQSLLQPPNKLFQGTFLHLAGRTSFDTVLGPGLELQGGKRLTSADIRLACPESLWCFLHLTESKTPQETPHYTAVSSFASSLLEEGALGVVAALSPSFSPSGRQMIGEFYRQLFEGNSPAQALRLARQQFRKRNPNDPTWSAFAYFGAPNQALFYQSHSMDNAARRTGTFVEGKTFRSSSPSESSLHVAPKLPIDPETSGTLEPLGAESSLEYDFDLEQAIGIALMEAKNLRQDFIGTPHLFIGLTKCPGGVTRSLLESMGFDAKKVRDTIRYALGFGHASMDAKILPTQRCARALKAAETNARRDQELVVREKHLLRAILESGEGLAFEVLKKMKANPERLLEKLKQGDFSSESDSVLHGETPTIDRFGRDLTQLAREGKLPPLTGRADALTRMAQILLRRFKNNPLIVGEAGIGKTALVEGMAQRIVAGAVPESLRERRIVELSLSSLVAGTRYRGDFEERLMQVLQEARENPHVILFLDEFHTVVGAGETHQGSLDAANILKPALARGELRCIGATTLVEYRKHIEKDAALDRRFHPIFLDEPTHEETLKILQGAREGYEEHHRVTIANETLAEAIELAERFLPARRFPDKALDLIDEACALITLRGNKDSLLTSDGRLRSLTSKPVVRPEALYKVLSDWTGIPVGDLSKEENERLMSLSEVLSRQIFGQPRAIAALAESLPVARAGLKRKGRPTGVFLFLGPSGVGKTLLSKTLASELFGDDKNLIRLDMSEFSEKHSSAKLMGAPPGYVGYGEESHLLAPLHLKPYSVVLLDEIEKAHTEVLDLFLQLFEEGRITDGLGRLIDGRHAVFIMTSNLLAERFFKRKTSMGFQTTDPEDMSAKDVQNELRRFFRPEFLNRIDDIVLFRPLDQDHLFKIAVSRFQEMSDESRKHGIELTYTSKALRKLVELHEDPAMGARPVLRALEQKVARPLSRIILAKQNTNDNYPLEVRLVLYKGELELQESRTPGLPPRFLLEARSSVSRGELEDLEET
jgi:ATP-dependent Clp protease ATP-binding subunit ClpA